MINKVKNLLKRNSRFLYAIYVFAAFCSSRALTLSLDLEEFPDEGISITPFRKIYELIIQLENDIKGKGLLLSVLTIAFLYLYINRWIKNREKVCSSIKIVSAVFALFYILGLSFSFSNNLYPFLSSMRLARLIVACIGMYALYVTVFDYLYVWLHKISENSAIDKKLSFLKSFFIIFGSWLIHLILRYPGTMSYDNADAIAYFWGKETFTTSQPIFHTVIFGSFIKFGYIIGNPNIGLFLYVLFQSTIITLILAYTIKLMQNWDINPWIRNLSMAIYCLAPYFVGYGAFPVKDMLYVAFFLLLVTIIYEHRIFTIEHNNYVGDDSLSKRALKWNTVLFILAGTMMILFRNNGIYVYVPIIVFLLVICLKNRCRDRKIWKYILIMIFPIALGLLIKFGITVSFNVVKDTPKEMLSFFVQQSARYVRDYGDELTEEEIEVIDKVLDVNKMGKVYLEMTSDPVKTLYHAENVSDLKDYFVVWFKMFFKHPGCYFEATWNQNYYMFMPNITNVVYNKDCKVAWESLEEMGMGDIVAFEDPTFMHGLCAIMAKFYATISELPIIGLLNNVAFYIMLMILISIFTFKDCGKKTAWYLLPLWISFIMIFLSPQIQKQPRYAFPIIYSMPITVAFYVKSLHVDNVDKGES